MQHQSGKTEGLVYIGEYLHNNLCCWNGQNLCFSAPHFEIWCKQRAVMRFNAVLQSAPICQGHQNLLFTDGLFLECSCLSLFSQQLVTFLHNLPHVLWCVGPSHSRRSPDALSIGICWISQKTKTRKKRGVVCVIWLWGCKNGNGLLLLLASGYCSSSNSGLLDPDVASPEHWIFTGCSLSSLDSSVLHCMVTWLLFIALRCALRGIRPTQMHLPFEWCSCSGSSGRTSWLAACFFQQDVALYL